MRCRPATRCTGRGARSPYAAVGCDTATPTSGPPPSGAAAPRNRPAPPASGRFRPRIPAASRPIRRTIRQVSPIHRRTTAASGGETARSSPPSGASPPRPRRGRPPARGRAADARGCHPGRGARGRLHFPPVAAAFSAGPRRLDARAAEERPAGLRCSAPMEACLLPQRVVAPLPGAVMRPFVEVRADPAPVREVRRRGRPPASGAIEGAERVDHLADVRCSRPPRPGRGANARLDEFPPGSGEVRRLSPPDAPTHPASTSLSTGKRPFLVHGILGRRRDNPPPSRRHC